MPGVKPKARLYVSGRRPRKWPLHRLGLMLGGVLTLGVSGIFLWNVGWPQRQATRLVDAVYQYTADLGFNLDDIIVEGRHFATRSDILDAMQVRRGMPILAIDRTAMLQRLENLPWLADVAVERRLPHTLYVRLYERQPLARWQFQNRVQVIDLEGKPLPPAAPRDFAELPLVVGEGAAENAIDLLVFLEIYPKVKQLMRAAVRVGDRRWDLILEPGITVKLPEGQEDEGLKRLADLIENQQILTRDVTGIDLRADDRWVVERAPGGNSGNAKTAAGTPKI